ncbi:MAG TPA: 30S ribosomal protein S2 [Candidatus Diapherotrites archaeon]|uniref:Small ribosomal subunit protein uS2 n=1 Tax=Candidatus Iainarchaeum sp. TaxID=3101447 RepID=A0A7J4JE11_9ARCH|nr:30S ribosomal protein S2 [Candidatus Diapherotrites archaeon]HIH15973.1 30S ribosomal protein S2 [Candidatus Diapherotrites archaeon]
MAEVTETAAEEQESGSNTVLLEQEKYLKTGAHIGTKFKSGEMRKYIYKVRKDGLKVLNIETLDQRLAIAARFLAQFPAKNVVAVSRKLYGQTPAKAFAEAIGGTCIVGRFVPGTLTNPAAKRFVEAKAVIVTEPEPDYQAIAEAKVVRIPVLALCSTNNSTKNVDLVIPINNKGRKSLALAYWLLAREFLKANGSISSDAEFTKSVEDFEYKMKEGEVEEEDYGLGGGKGGRGRGGRLGRGGPRERRGPREFRPRFSMER